MQVKLFLDQFSIRSAVLNAELPRNSRLHTVGPPHNQSTVMFLMLRQVREFNRGHVEYIIATDEALKAAVAASGAEAAEHSDDDAGGGGGSKKQKGKKAITKDKE